MRSILFALTLCAGFVLQDAHADASSDLHVLFAQYWDFEMREDPFSATTSGHYQYNNRVPGVAPEDYKRRLAIRKNILAQINSIDLSAVSSEDRLSANLLKFILGHAIDLAPFNRWRIPVLADTGFHSDIGYVVGATPFRTKKDYQDYLERLQNLPRFLDQNLSNMRLGLREGFTQPQQILPLIVPSFQSQVTATAEEHPLYGPFESIDTVVNAPDAKKFKQQARQILTDLVIPAYARALEFIQKDYLPNAVDKVGASNLPQGKTYYAALVRYYTTLDNATASDIHKLGLEEVARIREEMNGVIKQTGFEGSFSDFLEFLRTDPQFYAKSAKELLKEAAYIAKRIDGRLPRFFGKLPRQPYSVEPVPESIAQNYTTGRYVGAPPDGDRGGQYWVNTYALDKRPLYQLAALTLHEAVPGHHFQAALSYEIEGAPEFRTQFYPHAFGEGWGLYAEKLGVEMDIYQTPYEHFGRLSYEMWRACRLVIDTGLHDQNWTRQQAMDYLASNTALSLHNVQTEVDRYIAWPGQALAYKMGELTIWDLRRLAEDRLGEKFDLRVFHDAVLTGGGLPLELLTERIEQYIDDEQKN